MLAAEEGKKSGSGLEQAPRSPSPPSSSAIGRELGPPVAPSFMEGRVCSVRMRMRASGNAGDMGCICCPGLRALGSEWSGNVRVQRGRLFFVWRRTSRLVSSCSTQTPQSSRMLPCCGTYHETRIRTSVCKLAPQPYAVSHTLVEPSLTVSI